MPAHDVASEDGTGREWGSTTPLLLPPHSVSSAPPPPFRSSASLSPFGSTRNADGNAGADEDDESGGTSGDEVDFQEISSGSAAMMLPPSQSTSLRPRKILPRPASSASASKKFAPIRKNSADLASASPLHAPLPPVAHLGGNKLHYHGDALHKVRKAL